MRETGEVHPQGAGDRTGGPMDGQAAAASPRRRLGAPAAIGLAALAGWAGVAVAGGGIDPGDGLGGPGPTAAAIALAAGAPLAAAAALLAWGRPALRARPSLLALAAAAGTVAWSALSILWAAGPDLAWIDANRAAVGLVALTLGLALGALLPRAPAALGLGVAVAALAPIAVALAGKILPGALGSDDDLARLAEPVGYWNALALIAAMAVPGLVWLAAAPDAPRLGPPLAGAGLALVALTVLLTYSRGGVLAALAAAAVALACTPRRAAGAAALIAGAAGAAWPAAAALTDPLLNADRVPVDLREEAGAWLGLRLAVGLALAALLAPLLARWWARLRIDRRRARRVVALGAAVLALGAAAALASPAGRDWGGDRVSEFRGEGGDAVANDPGRLVNAAGNQRKAWWGEAWRAFRDDPLLGQGAGGFPLVHLGQREVGDDSLNAREPHDLVLRTMSGLGLPGLALLLALIGAVVWAVLRLAAGGSAGPEIGMPLAILAAFALQAAVDWSWAIPALTIPALAAAGVLLARAAPAAPARSRFRRRPGPLAAGAGAAAVVVAIASAALPWWSARAVAEGREALAAGRPEAALDHAAAARAANPLSLGPVLLRAAARSDLGEPARALGAYRRAARLQPDNPAAWRALAVFLGRDPRARDAWREVRRLDPQDAEAALRGG